jgi:hypothetical protein
MPVEALTDKESMQAITSLAKEETLWRKSSPPNDDEHH